MEKNKILITIIHYIINYYIIIDEFKIKKSFVFFNNVK